LPAGLLYNVVQPTYSGRVPLAKISQRACAASRIVIETKIRDFQHNPPKAVVSVRADGF
jgi:hypothetical protein